MRKPSIPANRWLAVSCFAIASAALGACDDGPDAAPLQAPAEQTSRTPSPPAPSATLDDALRTVDEFAPIGNPQDRPEPTIAASEAQPQPASTAIRAARAELQALNDSGVAGMIEFAQDGERVKVVGKVTGLPPGDHGFHIHQNGDCSAADGSSAGDHFAPHGRPHGAREAPAAQRHVGDLGNLAAGADGTADVSFSDDVIRLDGTDSIVDRAVIIHAKADDLSSQPSGDAGDRLACGVVREVIIEKTAPSTPVALRGGL